MSASNRPVANRSATMIGLEVAPVAPAARFDRTKSGSIESSHSFVPVASSDSIGLGIMENLAKRFK